MRSDDSTSNSERYDHAKTCGYLLESYELLVSCNGRRKRSMVYVSSLSRLSIFFLLLQSFAGTTADYYTGYIQSIIKNETESACEGGYLRIQCPVMTTITIQSAMYGRKVSSSEMCPVSPSLSAHGLLAEDVNCEALTSMAKTATECEDRRVCQLLVHAKVFGDDPCPNTSKYLTVKYKCRLMPDELRTRASCHDATMRLRCPRKRTFIAIYDVKLESNPACGDYVSKNCSMTPDDAFDYVTERCHRQQKCVLSGSAHTCGNFFHVEYACLPKRILTNQIPSSVLSAAASPDAVDDLTEAPPTTTSLVESTNGRIIPKIISVHPPAEQGTMKPPTNFSNTTAMRPITSNIPNKQSRFPLTTIETKQHRSKAQNGTRFEQPSGKDTSRKRNATKSPPPTSAIERQTSPKNKGVTNAIISTNEFPMPDDDRDDVAIDAGVTRPNSGLTYQISTISSVHPSNSTVAVAGVLSNSSMPQDIIVISVLAQLLAYFHQNSERILVVVLESICIGLFLAVLFLLFRCDRRQGLCGCKLKKEEAEQGRDGECSSLMGTSRRSQTESSSTNPGNIFNTQPTQTFASDHRGNHVDYISRVQDEHRRRKRRSKTHTLLKKCCSCCCTNAPWQRDHSDCGEAYRIPPRAPPANDDDDIISVDGSNRNRFEGPLPHAPPSLQMDEVDNRFPPLTASSVPASDGIPYADDTSEYEFQDNNQSPSTARSEQEPPPLVRPTSLQATFRSAPPLTQYSQQTFSNNGALHSPLPITQSSFHSSMQRQQHYDPPIRKREPPPFPKPVAYGYQPQNSQHSPHYTNQRPPYPQHPFQPPQHTRTAHQQPVSNHQRQTATQQRHPPAFASSTNDPYVSLRPQQHHPNTARTLNLTRNDVMSERRQSLYDNSLPRDSPMYEYYQRQQVNRQELPGTRNINQYYT